MNVAAFDAGLWHFRARLDHPLDGDSLVILADCGYRAAALPHIRIANLNAPERWTPEGPEATRRLAEALALGVGEWPLRVVTRQRETVVSEVTSFERFCGDIWVVQPDGSLVDVKDLVS